MTDRRRHSRFVLCNAWEGAIQLVEEVVVERSHDREIWVLSTSPGRRDEVLTLDLHGSGGALFLAVRVVESEPVLIEGTVRHRLRLAVEAQSTEPVTRSLPEPPVEVEP